MLSKQNKIGVPIIALVALLMTSFMVTSEMQPKELISTVAAKGYESIADSRAKIIDRHLLSSSHTDTEDSALSSATNESMRTQLQPEITPISTSTSIPSTLSLKEEGGFTAQAELINRYTAQSNNIVNKQAIYEVSFTTQTSGTIHRIELVFPVGTVVDGRLLIEREGIGPGPLVSSGNTLTYIVNNPVPVPEGTHIRLEIGNIRNPSTFDVPLTITITTRGALNAIIDGPTATNAYIMKQIGSEDLANGAVTTEKLANGAVTSGKVSSSFMVSRILNDGQNGWDPDGVILPKNFIIGDSAVKASNSHVYLSVDEPSDTGPLLVNVICMVEGITDGAFEVVCNAPPAETSKLRYTVINQP
jgi:hypothetical protein